jgi:hypothetical protein
MLKEIAFSAGAPPGRRSRSLRQELRHTASGFELGAGRTLRRPFQLATQCLDLLPQPVIQCPQRFEAARRLSRNIRRRWRRQNAFDHIRLAHCQIRGKSGYTQRKDEHARHPQRRERNAAGTAAPSFRRRRPILSRRNVVRHRPSMSRERSGEAFVSLFQCAKLLRAQVQSKIMLPGRVAPMRRRRADPSRCPKSP